jgi:hypothetical protein
MTDRHACRACLLFCMDFRFRRQLDAFLSAQGLDADGVDVIRAAGGAKNLARPLDMRDRYWLLEQIGISRDLHHARQVYIMNHEDCGAYGPEAFADDAEELDIHRKDLLAARDLVRERFVGMEVLPYFMGLDGRAEPIEDS